MEPLPSLFDYKHSCSVVRVYIAIIKEEAYVP